MRLTKGDQQQIGEWIKEKCGHMRCTCCGLEDWVLNEMATLPIVFDLHTTRFFYSQGIPHIEVYCKNCGHTLFFKASVLGFKPDRPKPEPVSTNETPQETPSDST